MTRRDVIIFFSPWDWGIHSYHEDIRKLSYEAEKNYKKIIITSLDDSPSPVPISNSIVLRSSLFKKTKKENEYILSAGYIDLLADACDGQLKIRDKSHVPKVSFCGKMYEPASWKQPWQKLTRDFAYKHIISRVDLYNRFLKVGLSLSKCQGRVLRTQAVYGIGRDENIETSFILRKKFLHGIYIPEIQKKLYVNQHKEFVDNIIESDYVLCVRGNGNFSYRFYETLSLGRIPLLIDSDCELPFEEIIDYDNLIVRVNADEINSLGKIVLNFHKKISAEDFRKRQKICRELWEEYLSIDGYFNHLDYYLNKAIG